MILYTVQHVDVWKTLKSKGAYKADGRRIMGQYFRPAYSWITAEAKKRISNFNCTVPIWFWVKKPDLRSYRFEYHIDFPQKTPHVLLTVDVDENNMIFTNFDDWHIVLNSDGIPKKHWNKIIREPDQDCQGIKSDLGLHEVENVRFFDMINVWKKS